MPSDGTKDASEKSFAVGIFGGLCPLEEGIEIGHGGDERNRGGDMDQRFPE